MSYDLVREGKQADRTSHWRKRCSPILKTWPTNRSADYATVTLVVYLWRVCYLEITEVGSKLGIEITGWPTVWMSNGNDEREDSKHFEAGS